MAYESLKALIREYIKPNDNEEITGAIMQSVLLAMIDELGVDSNYLPLTGGNLTGTTTVSSNLSDAVHSALRLAETGVTAESITNVGLSETLSLQPNRILYQCYYPSETAQQLSISFGFTGITVSGGITATSIIASGLIMANAGLYVPAGQTIRIGDAYLSWDATNHAIKVHGANDAAVNFYAMGGVSALGYSGSGGGGGGATALGELIDVTLSSPANGQVLMYNGSKWVNSAAPATGLTSIGMTVPTGLSVSPATLTANGTFAISFASGYSLPTTAKQSNWDTAYGWGNHALAGYLTSSSLSGYATQTWVSMNYIPATAGAVTNTMLANSSITIAGTSVSLGGSISAATIGNALTRNAPAAYATEAGQATQLATPRTLWGQYFDGTANVTGSLTDVGYIFQHGNYFLMNSGTNDYGLMIEGQGYNLGTGVGRTSFGFHTASSTNDVSWYNNGIVMQLYQDANDRRLEVYKIRIGGVHGIDIAYDADNNALKIVNSDGTAANLYATGGVSALGFSAGTSSVDSFAFNYLTVNNQLTMTDGSYITGTNIKLRKSISGNISYLYLFNSTSEGLINNETYYFNKYFNTGLFGEDYNGDESWMIDPDGCAKFNRLYLDGTRYLHLSGTSLKYYNGSSDITIA